ncbi:hypothetical protein KX928_21660 [Roseobacter sp. YSTF-M11]|uniref:UrcA family protein n=1 Tax=Roseobacter insulae TaxID=2859783 RepID=A0A9X1FZ85_9RHOB|nr:hypothetical protein [Roseobacter insulae]MBW4710406.1 hypothetical protein [Roseobacter insulae]
MTQISAPSLTLSAVLVLSASAGFAATKSGSITVYGQEYKTITREFQHRGETVLTGEVRVYNRSWGCDTTRPGDCEEVAKRVLNSSGARTVEGAAASAIREIIRTPG